MNVEKIEQIMRNDSSGSLAVLCRIDGEQVQLSLKVDVAEEFLKGLLGMPAPKSGRPTAQIAIRPTGLSTFRGEGAQKGFSIHLPSGVLIRVLADSGASDALRKLADQLDQM